MTRRGSVGRRRTVPQSTTVDRLRFGCRNLEGYLLTVLGTGSPRSPCLRLPRDRLGRIFFSVYMFISDSKMEIHFESEDKQIRRPLPLLHQDRRNSISPTLLILLFLVSLFLSSVCLPWVLTSPKPYSEVLYLTRVLPYGC